MCYGIMIVLSHGQERFLGRPTFAKTCITHGHDVGCVCSSVVHPVDTLRVRPIVALLNLTLFSVHGWYTTHTRYPINFDNHFSVELLLLTTCYRHIFPFEHTHTHTSHPNHLVTHVEHHRRRTGYLDCCSF